MSSDPDSAEAFNAWALSEALDLLEDARPALLAQRLLRAAVEGVRKRMKDQLALNHILGLSRIRDRQAPHG